MFTTTPAPVSVSIPSPPSVFPMATLCVLPVLPAMFSQCYLTWGRLDFRHTILHTAKTLTETQMYEILNSNVELME